MWNVWILFILNLSYGQETCNDACLKNIGHGGVDYVPYGTKLGCKCNINCCAQENCDILCLEEAFTPIIYDYMCGKHYYSKNCSGLWKGQCCSEKGFCGTSLSYCNQKCQRQYGPCFMCIKVPVYSSKGIIYFETKCYSKINNG